MYECFMYLFNIRLGIDDLLFYKSIILVKLIFRLFGVFWGILVILFGLGHASQASDWIFIYGQSLGSLQPQVFRSE